MRLAELPDLWNLWTLLRMWLIFLSLLVSGSAVTTARRNGQNDLIPGPRPNRLGNCITRIKDAYRRHQPRPWIPRDPPLSVCLDLVFHSSPLALQCGQNLLCHPSWNITTNPNLGLIFDAVQLRADTTRTVRMSSPGGSLTGRMFTLLMVDPDVPPEYRLATNERPLLKWLVTNIADGQFDRGDVIVDYVPVAPPTDALTPYYFLLFEQRGQLPRFTFGDFSDPDCRDDRCLYDVERFRRSLNLRLVGITWVTVRRDAYLRCSGAG